MASGKGSQIQSTWARRPLAQLWGPSIPSGAGDDGWETIWADWWLGAAAPAEIVLDHLGPTATANQPAIGQQVAMAQLAAATVVYNAIIQLDAQVALAALAATAATFEPGVVASQSVTLQTIAGGAAAYSPAIAQQVALPDLGPLAVVNTPAILAQVALAHLANPADVFEPAIDTSTQIAMETVAAATQLFAPRPDQQILLDHLANPTTVHQLEVLAGALFVALTAPTPETVLNPPARIDQTVDGAHHGPTGAAHSPSVAQNVAQAHIDPTVALFAPSALYRTLLAHLTAGATLYPPTFDLTVGGGHAEATTDTYPPGTLHLVLLDPIADTEVWPPAITVETVNVILAAWTPATAVHNPAVIAALEETIALAFEILHQGDGGGYIIGTGPDSYREVEGQGAGIVTIPAQHT